MRDDSRCNSLKSSVFATPLGEMIAIADEDSLYLLEFIDKIGLNFEVAKLGKTTKMDICSGGCEPIASITKELASYFAGEKICFKTKLHLLGSEFQKSAWRALIDVPYGETNSYSAQAAALGRPSACRAVANANGANKIAIAIPCHRIINSNGKIGGYSGGIARKKWLIEHERSVVRA